MTGDASWAQYSTVEGGGTTHRMRFRCRSGYALCLGGVAAVSVVLGVCVMLYQGTEERYTRALQIAQSFKPLDTQRNKIATWLGDIPKRRRRGPGGHRGPQRDELPGPGIPGSHFQWTWPHGSPPPKGAKKAAAPRDPGGHLRLPLGIAASLALARLEVERRDDKSVGIASPPRPREDQNLLLTLGQTIPAVASLGADDAQAGTKGGMSKHAQAELHRVLTMVADAHVHTEVPPQSPLVRRPCHPAASPASPCAKAHLLESQLRNMEQTGEGEGFQDVMAYPGEGGAPAVLYCGSFKGLRFDGRGVMFYRSRPQRPVYIGHWRHGAMSGSGALYDKAGEKVWEGEFVDGKPVRNLFNMLHNVRKGML